MSFDAAGDGLHGLLARWIQDPDGRWAVIRDAWRKAAGPAVADKTRLLGLEEGELRVRIEDPRWSRPLREMESGLVRRLNRMLGTRAVRRIRWLAPDHDPGHR